jgi:hypothetical protein
MLNVKGHLKKLIQSIAGELQIPTEVGQGYQGEAGQHSEMMSATVPI